jgi:hypothetical protein
VELSSSTGDVDNSSSIIGQSMGIRAGGHFYPDELVTIHNTGLIKGAHFFQAHEGPVHETNMGIMNGHIGTTDSAQTTLINGGKIVGTVQLSQYDDIFRAIMKAL